MSSIDPNRQTAQTKNDRAVALLPSRLPPKIELDLAQTVRLNAAIRLMQQATQPTNPGILASRVLALPADTAEEDWVHIPLNFAEGVHLTGPAVTPRLQALWNSFLGLMDSIRTIYEAKGEVDPLNALINPEAQLDGLANRFIRFLEQAAQLTVEEITTIVRNLPNALEAVQAKLPSFAAIGDAITDIRGRIPAPAQAALDRVVQVAPAVLAVASLFSTPALIGSLVIEMLPSIPTTARNAIEDAPPQTAPPIPPQPTVYSRITHATRQFFNTDRGFFTFFTAAFSLCMYATLSKINEHWLEEHCLIASEDTRSTFDFVSDAPLSYQDCLANGWPKG